MAACGGPSAVRRDHLRLRGHHGAVDRGRRRLVGRVRREARRLALVLRRLLGDRVVAPLNGDHLMVRPYAKHHLMVRPCIKHHLMCALI